MADVTDPNDPLRDLVDMFEDPTPAVPADPTAALPAELGLKPGMPPMPPTAPAPAQRSVPVQSDLPPQPAPTRRPPPAPVQPQTPPTAAQPASRSDRPLFDQQPTTVSRSSFFEEQAQPVRDQAPMPAPAPAPAHYPPPPAQRPVQQQAPTQMYPPGTTEIGPGPQAPPRGYDPLPETEVAPRAPQAPQPRGRRQRNAGSGAQAGGPSKQARRAAAREARWRANRYAVPYWTDGPKVMLGIGWFILLAGSAVLGYYFSSPVAASAGLALIGAGIAGLAGLQAGFAWLPKTSATRSWTAGVAAVVAVAGFLGPWGVIIGLVVGLIAVSLYVVLYRGHRRPTPELFDVLFRSAVPAGVAMASLAALAQIEPGGLNAAMTLILMVSAYEVGDFMVGSGASNAFEGPLAGVVALGVVAFFLFLLTPEPFSTSSALLFSSIAALCCPLGQIAASALLPRGTAWAPALRRIDSYLVVAPLWLLLLALSPGLAT